jgi:multidrug efflux pump subunit AcrB
VNIAKFSIEKNRISLMILVMIIAIGLVMYQSISRDSMPSYTVRVANVVSFFPGAGPERVEQLITDKIEKMAQELPELKEVSSSSQTGLSVVTVILKEEVDPDEMQSVWNRLRRNLSTMEGLPAGVYPILKDDGLGEVYGIVVGLVSDGFSYADMKEYADKIRNELIKIPDAAKVVLGGVQNERVFIEFDNTLLKEYGLTTGMLHQFISTTNILSSGGELSLGEERVIVEPTGNFNSVEDIKNMLVPAGANTVRLGDITTVKKGYVDPATQRVSINGKNAISLHVNLKKNANIIQLGEEVNKVINQYKGELPVGLELTRVSSLDNFIDDKVSSFIVNLLQSFGIVLLIMLLFLGFRTGLVIASLIPIVIIMTLMIMGLFDIGLNQVTLASLIMALGMLVDNAIVVAETVMVKMEKGIAAKKAAIGACSELARPLLISTLITSCAFLAFFLSPTNMGDIVGPIFQVITIALLSSWIIALTIITMFCVLFLKVKPKAEQTPSLVDRLISKLKMYYKEIIIIALKHKGKVLGSISIAFVLAVIGFGFIPFLFIPDSDRNMITVDINLPVGTKIQRTTDLVSTLEAYMKDSLQVNAGRESGIQDWSCYIGQGPESYDLGYTQGEANSSYAHILVNTSSFLVNKDMINKLNSFAFNAFPNADVKVRSLSNSGGAIPIEVRIIGNDADELANIALNVREKLTATPGTKNVKDNWGPKSKKFVVNIDPNRAQAAGITHQDIAISLQTVLDGFQTGEYREDNKSIPILMRGENSQEQSLSSLETLNVYAQATGQSVPLSQVASITPDWQYSTIRRYNLNKAVYISSQLREGAFAANIIAELTPWLEEQKQTWPAGFTYEFGGDEKDTAENLGSVIGFLPLSGFLIALLLIIQFNSFRKMTVILSIIPLALIGVVLGLLVSGEPFGFMPFLGLIALAGILIYNGVVLIDRIDMEQNDLGRDMQDSIVMACLQRMRPILLATFTTVLGLLPLYISGGELWEGLAISIMVGLLFGTVITLVFIPSLYSVLFKVNFSKYQFNKKLLEDL